MGLDVQTIILFIKNKKHFFMEYCPKLHRSTIGIVSKGKWKIPDVLQVENTACLLKTYQIYIFWDIWSLLGFLFGIRDLVLTRDQNILERFCKSIKETVPRDFLMYKYPKKRNYLSRHFSAVFFQNNNPVFIYLTIKRPVHIYFDLFFSWHLPNNV